MKKQPAIKTGKSRGAKREADAECGEPSRAVRHLSYVSHFLCRSRQHLDGGVIDAEGSGVDCNPVGHRLFGICISLRILPDRRRLAGRPDGTAQNTCALRGDRGHLHHLDRSGRRTCIPVPGASCAWHWRGASISDRDARAGQLDASRPARILARNHARLRAPRQCGDPAADRHPDRRAVLARPRSTCSASQACSGPRYGCGTSATIRAAIAPSRRRKLPVCRRRRRHRPGSRCHGARS